MACEPAGSDQAPPPHRLLFNFQNLAGRSARQERDTLNALRKFIDSVSSEIVVFEWPRE
jgi:hypothetical protein